MAQSIRHFGRVAIFMINRLRLYNPDFADIKMPDLDLSKLEAKRETHISRDKYGEYHFTQKRDGITHVITMDRKELIEALKAVDKLEQS